MKPLMELIGYLLKAEFLAGYRTYIAAAGAVGISVYYLADGQYEQAALAFTAALGLLGLREKKDPVPPPEPEPTGD